MKNSVKKEKKIIPTYIPAKAMDLPMFFEKKPYQGASGRLYPLPFSDSISDEKTDVGYDVYTLENEYIMTQVLPDKGGKILRGYDKVGVIPAGASMEYLDESQADERGVLWYYVDYDGMIGWASSKYIELGM